MKSNDNLSNIRKELNVLNDEINSWDEDSEFNGQVNEIMTTLYRDLKEERDAKKKLVEEYKKFQKKESERIKASLKKTSNTKTKLDNKSKESRPTHSSSYPIYNSDSEKMGDNAIIDESEDDIAKEYDLVMDEIRKEKDRIKKSNLKKSEKKRKLEGIENAIKELEILNRSEDGRPSREEEAPGTLRAVWEAYKQADFQSEITNKDGKKKVGQQVHHLSGYNWDINNRTNLDNLILLSEDVHDEFHGLYGYGNNTIEQFLEFLYNYRPEDVHSFKEKYVSKEGLDNIENKLIEADPSWGKRTRQTQFNRSIRLPVLENLHDLDFNAKVGNIPYSSFFLRNMEIPIDGTYEKYGRVHKSAQLSTSDNDVLKIYDDDTSAKLKYYESMKREKGLNKLRNILTARRIVESTYGLYDKKSIDELLEGNAFKELNKAQLMKELKDSHVIGRKRLEKRVSGELPMPFLDGKYDSIDYSTIGDGLGSGLTKLLDRLKKFFDEFEKDLGFHPLKEWGSSPSKNEDILKHLFEGKGIIGLSGKFTHNLPVDSEKNPLGYTEKQIREVLDGRVIETPNDILKVFRDMVDNQPSHDSKEKPTDLDKYDNAHKDIKYLLAIFRRGFSEETIARFVNTEGYRRRITNNDDMNALRDSTKPNGKGVRGTVNEPETDTSKIDAKLNEIKGVPTHVTLPGGLALAQELQKYRDERDFVQNLKPNQTVNVEGTSPKNENKEFIGLGDISEFRKITTETNQQIRTLRIAIYRAIKTLNGVFGEFVPSNNNQSKLDDFETKQLDKAVDEDVEKYKKGLDDSEDKIRPVKIKPGEDVDMIKSKFGLDEDSALSYEELVGSLKRERNLKNKLYKKTNASLFKKRVDELDAMLAVFEDIFSKGDPTRFQQAFSDIQANNSNLSANDILSQLTEISEGGRTTWDALQSFRATIIDEVNDTVEWTNNVKDQSQALLNRDVKGVMFRALNDAGLNNYGADDNRWIVEAIRREQKEIRDLEYQVWGKYRDRDETNVPLDKRDLVRRIRRKRNRINELSDMASIGNTGGIQNPLGQVIGIAEESQQIFRVGDSFKEKMERAGFDDRVEYLKSLRNSDMVKKELQEENKKIIPDLEKNEIAFAHFATELSKRRADLEKIANASNFNAKIYGDDIKDFLDNPLSDDSIKKAEELRKAKEAEIKASEIKPEKEPLHGRLTTMAYNFRQATASINQFTGVLTKLFAIVGSGNALNDMITASSLRQTNQIMLASRRGMEEAEKLYDRIQMLVVKLPGNDTFLTNILTMLGTMDETLTAEDLEYMGGVIADYYMGAQAKGQFNNETERELRNYLMTGQTRNLTNSIIASEVESLKNLNTVKERTVALEKALQKTGMDSIAHYDSYTNTLEEFKGRFQKSFADLGDTYLGMLQLGMKLYNVIDSLTNSWFSQLTIVSAVGALLGISIIGVGAELLSISAGLIEAMDVMSNLIANQEKQYSGYAQILRRVIAWIGVKIGVIEADSVAFLFNGEAINTSTRALIANSLATVRNTLVKKGLSWTNISEILSRIWNTVAIYGEVVALDKEIIATLGSTEAKEFNSFAKAYNTYVSTEEAKAKIWSAMATGAETEAEVANTEAKTLNTSATIGNIWAKIKKIATDIGSIISTTSEAMAEQYSLWVKGEVTFMTFLEGEANIFLTGTIEALKIALGPVGAIFEIIGDSMWVFILLAMTLIPLIGNLGEQLGIWKTLWSPVEAILDGINSFLGNIVSGLGRVWDAFMNSEPIQDMIIAFQNLAYTIESFFNLIWSIGGNIWQTIFGVDDGRNQVFDILGAFLEIVGAIGNLAYMISPLKVFVEVLNKIGSAIGWILDTWNEFVDSDEFQGIIKDFQDIRKIIGEAWSILAEAFGEVKDAFMSIFEDDEQLEETKSSINWLLEVLKAIATLIRVTIIPVIKTVAMIIKGIAMAIKTVADIFSGFVGFFTNFGDYVGNFMGTIAGMVDYAVQELASIPSRVLGTLVDGVTGGLYSSVTGTIDWLLGNDNSNLENQRQLAQNYAYNTNDNSVIINNNFGEGSVQADARNMTAKDVQKLFVGAFGYNTALGTRGILG